MSVDPRPGASEALPRERLPRAFGKFALKRRLARGGMADVYLASLAGAEGFEKELVVKLIRPELAADEAFVRRFVDEAKTCVRLTHPNIVSIFELGVETGVLYLAMDLVRGATLAEVLQEGGPLKADEGAYIALEVARALHHAHRRGVIHRDVTPGNVMLDDEGAVKLLDFGIAAPAGLDVEVFGTPGHMPPEQIEGRALTGAADLFALGTVMLEAWTGRPPFRRADARASKTALHEKPPMPSTAHAELAPLDDVVASMLAIDPKHRPQHADEIARVLRAYLRERNVDLDEVARALSQRVRRAVVAREDREAGRATAAPPMPKAMRPTPLGDATRTFATRGAIDTWSGGETRKVDADESQELREEESSSLPAPPSATRRIEETETKPAPASARGERRSRGWIVGVLVVAAAAGAIVLARGSGTAVSPPTSATISTSATPSPSAPTAPTSALPSASTFATPSVFPSASTSASVVASSTSSASAAPTVARLVVTSSPPAAVELDGRSLGQTPISTTAALGDHRLVLRPKGLGESFERRVTLGATWGMDVHGDFNDEPQITLRRTPAGAK